MVLLAVLFKLKLFLYFQNHLDVCDAVKSVCEMCGKDFKNQKMVRI